MAIAGTASAGWTISFGGQRFTSRVTGRDGSPAYSRDHPFYVRTAPVNIYPRHSAALLVISMVLTKKSRRLPSINIAKFTLFGCSLYLLTTDFTGGFKTSGGEMSEMRQLHLV